MRHVYRRQRRGFTLVELLVVIGIIALLISILLPSLAAARERGNAVKCLSNVRQLGMAFIMYAGEHKGVMPWPSASRHGLHKESDWIFWQSAPTATDPTVPNLSESLVVRYLGPSASPDALRCPSDPWQDHGITSQGGATLTDGFGGAYLYSYSANSFILNGAKPFRITQVKDATSKFLLGEESELTIDDGNWSIGTGYGNNLAIRHSGKAFPDTAGNWTLNFEKQGNVSFLDGHAEYTTRSVVHNPRCYDPSVN